MVETPGGESMVKQMVQIGTQKFIEAGNGYRVGDPSVEHVQEQAFDNNSTVRWRPIPSSLERPGNMGQQFPPTHGIPTPVPLVSKDPGLISILDLESLAQHSSSTASSPHPLATFKVPHGCSFLSFAPSGLALFTASSKGDVQSVWDLMRIQYAKSSFLKAGFKAVGFKGLMFDRSHSFRG
jgi:hypothetical protein